MPPSFVLCCFTRQWLCCQAMGHEVSKQTVCHIPMMSIDWSTGKGEKLRPASVNGFRISWRQTLKNPVIWCQQTKSCFQIIWGRGLKDWIAKTKTHQFLFVNAVFPLFLRLLLLWNCATCDVVDHCFFGTYRFECEAQLCRHHCTFPSCVRSYHTPAS